MKRNTDGQKTPDVAFVTVYSVELDQFHHFNNHQPATWHSVERCFIWRLHLHVSARWHACRTRCSLPLLSLLLSHNQWPFCLRWWMMENRSVSKRVVRTVSSSFPPSCLWLSVLLLPYFPQKPISRRSTAHSSAKLCCVHVPVFLFLFCSLFLLMHAWSTCIVTCHHSLSKWLMSCLGLLSLSLVGGCVSSLQARMENEIFDYKDLAALPKVKAIYEVQQPDLISSSYHPYHRYTSDERLDTFTYGEVLLPHTSRPMHHCDIPILFLFKTFKQ